MPRSTAVMPKGGEVVPQRTTTARCSPPSTAQSPAVALPPQGVGAPLLGRRCRLALLPGGCFIRPFQRPRPYLRRALGCFPVVWSGIRVVAAPRGSNPPSRFNPQAALRVPAAKTAVRIQAAPIPVCDSAADSTSKLHRAFLGPGDAHPQVRQAGEKTRGTKRFESNGPPQQRRTETAHAEGAGLALPAGRLLVAS